MTQMRKTFRWLTYSVCTLCAAFLVGSLSFAPTTQAADVSSLKVIKTASSPDMFIHLSIGRYRIRDGEAWARWGFSWSQVKTISTAEMNAIPRGPDIGKALRPFNDPTVYVVENGAMRAVTSSEAFLLSGYNWAEVTNVERDIVNTLDRGADLYAPSAIRSPKDGRIYAVSSGAKYHIADANVYSQWGFGGYVTNALIDQIPTGGSLTALVKTSNNPTVWVVDRSKLRALPSPDALLLNNFSWSQLSVIPEELLSRLSKGDIFYAPTTVRFPNSTDTYFVDRGVKYKVSDTDTFNNWGFANLGSTVSANLSLMKDGPSLTRLSRAEDGTVYRVVDGTYRLVPSEGVFNGYGFSWAQVTTIPRATLQTYLTEGRTLDYTVPTLSGYSLPFTTGKVGLEQHLWTTAGEGTDAAHYALTGTPVTGEFINLRNGVAGSGAFGLIDPTLEKWYITMRWNYCEWYEAPDGPDENSWPDTKTRNCNSTATNWHKGKKIIVTNVRTGRKIVVGIGESGPAIWITTQRGVVSGMSPEATDYIVGTRFGTNGDILEYGWSADQNLPLGPLNF